MIFKLHSYLIEAVLAILFAFLVMPLYGQGDTNGKRLTTMLKEVWLEDNWTNDFRSEYQYDSEGLQTIIAHSAWETDHWENIVEVQHSYNDENLLAERQEEKMSDGSLLSYERYFYDDQNKLTRMTFPEDTWSRVRNAYDTVLTNQIHSINQTYLWSGETDLIKFNSTGDLVASTQGPADVEREYKVSYHTNGQQTTVLYQQNPTFTGRTDDKAWDLYEIWFPLEARTTWMYSEKESSDEPYHFVASHVNPENRHHFFRDQLGFWLSRSGTAESPLYTLGLYGIDEFGSTVSEYSSSKIQNSLSYTNYYIPGNYHSFFYEPRFQFGYPFRGRQLLRVVEQYMLRYYKINSPLYYFSWDYNWTWVNGIERTFEYDDQGRLTATVIRTWQWDKDSYNPVDGWWMNDSRYEFTYNASGNGSQVLRYIWDNDSSAWQNAARFTYTYEDIPAGKIQSARKSVVQLTNNPNPFSESTDISFQTENPTTASLKIYDLSGRLIRTILEDEPLVSDEHSYRWDGRDQYGRDVPSGVYLYRLETDNLRKTGRCLVVK